MKVELGMMVYKYTFRGGKFYVHEGRVIKQGGRRRVYFEDITSVVRVPSDDEFGIVCTNGPSLWLTERNDELAKRTFLVYEEERLAELQAAVNRKIEMINYLKEEL